MFPFQIEISIKTGIILIVFLNNGPNPASFSFIFGLFQTNNTIFTTNQCEKCHVHPVSGD